MGGGKDIRRGLEPLEFEECIVDSPEFRDNLNKHEKELDHTSHQIKRIIKEVKDLMSAAKVLSTRMKQLAILLNDFNFECIGTAQTDDENVICESLKRFGAIIGNIEDEREKMLTLADKHIIESLEDFRKKQIGGVKENKKKFDKKTEKFCQSQERFLNMSTKKPENTIQETRENFEEAREKVTELKTKYMEKRTKPEEIFTKRGYLFLMEKSSLLKISILEPFKAAWTKYYCTFKKQKREFTMLQFNQMNHNFTKPEAREDEKLTLFSCQRRASEFEKRFCFDLTFKEKPGIVYTFQALSEKDYRSWLSAMDGTEPTFMAPGKIKANEAYQLDETGFIFVRRCINVLESRGLEDEGIYRKSGVGTKISKLLALGMSRKDTEDVFIEEKYRELMESNTIASALKMYLRNLSEPLMTYHYHTHFIEAAKQEGLHQRINEVHKLVYKLPQPNFEMLDMVIKHLTEVSRKYDKNKMSVFNLGVVFGPTLLRPLEETVAAILDIKFNNIVINILIDNYERIFRNDPSSDVIVPTSTSSSIHHGSNSPPMRMPRASQACKALSTGGAGSTTGRSPIYSPQQKIYHLVNKANCEEPINSTSLQNIPNGINFPPGPSSANSSTPTGGSIGTAGSDGGGAPLHASNGVRPSTLGSIKNLHTLTLAEISSRRLTGSSTGATNEGVPLQTHHAALTNSISNLRHPDYVLATVTPVTQSVSNSHIYTNISGAGATTSNLLSMKNASPPSAMRKERLLATGGGNAVSGPQQHPPVQLSHFGYGHSKHYSPLMAASTSSSNESMCDSLSSNNGMGTAIVSNTNSVSIGHHLSTRNSNEYTPFTSQTSLMPAILGSTSDSSVMVTAAPPNVGGNLMGNMSGGGTTNESFDYPPTKMHRNRDINQIKRDLSTGAARVRTLYACMGESEGELSFEPNQIITNVRFSHEPGWLQGTLNAILLLSVYVCKQRLDYIDFRICR
ncbi:rho GTPase-activating protein 26 isoform X6 [Drosophila guanche]|uniref:rho GTPase-activating protein 26 isoform X6 n=1 Tax=Drosophila guanche TaxID=7266 RepID=UPI0014717D52|nr:rho GTPase-activating protein 26 isoform X6 [Drosophila guanche]